MAVQEWSHSKIPTSYNCDAAQPVSFYPVAEGSEIFSALPTAAPGNHWEALSFLHPEAAIDPSMGLPHAAVCGFLQQPNERSPGFPHGRHGIHFAENSAFVELMHQVIAETGPSLRSMAEAAAMAPDDGYLYVIDLRTPDGPQGDVPPVDIIGSFKVKGGVITPASYKPSSCHSVMTEDGIVHLPRDMYLALLAAMRECTRGGEHADRSNAADNADVVGAHTNAVPVSFIESPFTSKKDYDEWLLAQHEPERSEAAARENGSRCTMRHAAGRGCAPSATPVHSTKGACSSHYVYAIALDAFDDRGRGGGLEDDLLGVPPPGNHWRTVSLLSPSDIEEAGSLAPEAVCGWLLEPSFRFVQNRAFVRAMHIVIATVWPELTCEVDGVLCSAKDAAAGLPDDSFLYFLDLRTPNGAQTACQLMRRSDETHESILAGANVPLQEIIGRFKVTGGQITIDSYEALGSHQVMTVEGGMVQLPPPIHAELVGFLVSPVMSQPHDSHA